METEEKRREEWPEYSQGKLIYMCVFYLTLCLGIGY